MSVILASNDSMSKSIAREDGLMDSDKASTWALILSINSPNWGMMSIMVRLLKSGANDVKSGSSCL